MATETETDPDPTAPPTAPASEFVTGCLIIIGNEILSGRTQDANLAYVGQKLNDAGVQLRHARVIPDIEEVIVGTINECRATYDYVFTTGGIGPTHDDITAASVAKAFGVPLIRHPDAVALLEGHYQPGQLTEARLKMAEVPEGGDLVQNPISKAPGFRVENVFVMAGVPRIMQAQLDGVIPLLRRGATVLSKTVTVALGESSIADGLSAIQEQFPDLDIGSYPYYNRNQFGTSIVMRGTSEERIDAAAETVRALMRAHGGQPIEGEPA